MLFRKNCFLVVKNKNKTFLLKKTVFGYFWTIKNVSATTEERVNVMVKKHTKILNVNQDNPLTPCLVASGRV